MEYGDLIKELREIKDKAPKLFGVKTGTKLDEMFYSITIEDDKVIRRPLGGLPYLSVMNAVGAPDTGKSVLAEQFATVQAYLGYKVLFVTTEMPANFLYNGIRAKALALGLRMEDIEENIITIDASKSEMLRENIKELLKAMDYAIEKKRTSITIVDSITGFFESREMMARGIVRAVYSFLKDKRQTALLVSQKRSSQSSETAEAAGGLAVAHIVDGSIVFDKKVITNRYESALYGMDIGEVLRTIRIDGCRITAHDDSTHVMWIRENGLIDIGEKLSEYIAKVKR